MYDEWSGNTPFITRSSMVGIVILYIASFFFSADVVLGNIPYFSVMHFEIYRIILSPVVGNSLITIIMICLFYPMMGTRMERALGSCEYFLQLCTFSLATNIIFDAICVSAYIFGVPEALFWGCSGFWTILFGLIVVECMQIPDAPRRLLCFPVDIPSKYFPLVLYVFFCLFSGPQLDFAVSMSVGYMFSKGYLNFAKPSIATIQRMESGFLSSCTRYNGWVGSESALGLAVYSGDVGDQPRSDYQAAPTASGMESLWRGGREQNTNSTVDQFPGSGRTLTSRSSVLSSALSGQSSSATTREAMAARRLKALSEKGLDVDRSSSFVAGSSAPPSRTHDVDDSKLNSLVNMGFPMADAEKALKECDNSVEAAVQYLSA